ncbi:MAG: Ig-like domain-containing protein [Treponema sp.]|jgi:uncharacterized protein YjdB|nr:Ig-like domain-containing protein [Treponema sp.]
MKKIIGVGFITLLASIVFSACFAVIDPPLSSAGRITLSLEGLQQEVFRPDVRARTLFPDDIDSFTYTITFSPSAVVGPVGESPVVRNISSASVGVTETLRTGFWDIDVEARFGGGLVGSASVTVEILYNQTIEKVILINPIGGANGNLYWSIAYDNFDLINKIEVEYNGTTLDIFTDNSDNSIWWWEGVYHLNNNSGNGSVWFWDYNNLSPGSYTFKVVLKNPFSGDLAGRVEVVHIYPGLTTTLDWEFEVKPVRVTGVTFDKNNLAIDLTSGINTVALVATIEPPDATNPNLIWSSSNPTVAMVDSNGMVMARKAGSAIITVTTDDGGYSDTCAITITGSTIWNVNDDGTVDLLLWGGDITVPDYWIGMLSIFTTGNGGPLDIAWIVPGTKIELTTPAGSAYCAVISIYDGPGEKTDFYGDDLHYNITNRAGIDLTELLCIYILSGNQGEDNQLIRVVLKNVPEGLVTGL